MSEAMKPECCGTGTPSGCAGLGSRPPPGRTAIMDTSMLAPSTDNSSMSTDVLGGTKSLSAAFRVALIGIHHLRVRVVLVDAHDMAQIAALRCGKLGQSLDDEIALAPITWRTAQRMPGLANNLRCEAVLEIDRHVTGKKQPRSGTHALGVFDVGAAYSRRGDAPHFSHCQLLCCLTVGGRNAWKTGASNRAVRGHDSGAGAHQPLQRHAARKAAPTDQVRSLTLVQGNLTVLRPSCSCCPPEAEFVAGRQSSQDLRRRASALRGAGWCQYRDCRWRILLSAWPLRVRKIDATQYSRRV